MNYTKLLFTLPAASLLALACSSENPTADSGNSAAGSGGSSTTSSSSSTTTSAAGGASATTGTGGAASAITAENVIEEAAKSVCSALTRCCDADSQKFYFDPFRDAEFLQEYQAQLPNGELMDEASCLSLMKNIYPKIWLGSWLERVAANEAEFDGNAAATCLATLDNAACGEPLRDALFDTTCFSNSAPGGGDEQRVIFKRTQTAGASCAPVRDGFGGLYYGSCQAENSFCCIEDSMGNCSPFPSLSKTGTCKTASQLDEACNDFPMQLCATGLFCNTNILKCEKPTYSPLQVGEACMEGIDFLGDCVNSWCDFSSKKCEPLKAPGKSCSFSMECDTGWCSDKDKTCIANPICNE